MTVGMGKCMKMYNLLEKTLPKKKNVSSFLAIRYQWLSSYTQVYATVCQYIAIKWPSLKITTKQYWRISFNFSSEPQVTLFFLANPGSAQLECYIRASGSLAEYHHFTIFCSLPNGICHESISQSSELA